MLFKKYFFPVLLFLTFLVQIIPSSGSDLTNNANDVVDWYQASNVHIMKEEYNVVQDKESAILLNDAQCGGILTAFDDLQRLSYRTLTPMDEQFVSCIWTIYAPHRNLIKLNVTEPNHWSVWNFIAVGHFKNSEYDILSSFIWTKIPNVYAPQYLEIPGPVAFIHFSATNIAPYFGFELTYAAGGEKQNNPNYYYENYFLEGTFGKFKYPSQGEYTNNRRTTIVLKTKSKFSKQDHPFASRLFVLNRGIEESQGCLKDNINLYGFGAETDMWYKNQTWCGKTTNGTIGIQNPRNDPVIITFKSDDTGVANGFELRWMEYSYS